MMKKNICLYIISPLNDEEKYMFGNCFKLHKFKNRS